MAAALLVKDTDKTVVRASWAKERHSIEAGVITVQDAAHAESLFSVSAVASKCR